jgi:hypothetical protein
MRRRIEIWGKRAEHSSAATRGTHEVPSGAGRGGLMADAERPPAPPDPDEVLLERLREIAHERDSVPDEVLAAAKALFAPL